MTAPLWTLEAFAAAAGGRIVGAPAAAILGISIDTRTLKPGDAFVALAGEQTDGHAYVERALGAGAACALVSEDKLPTLPAGGRYVVVADTLKALEAVGCAARARVNARIVAVTGSVGKTSTKEALRAVLADQAPTHAAVASFNNHIGVPLTLARMPADVTYAVFEIGMNHSGEITPLVAMVRPHVAIVTTIAPVHLEHFSGIDAIAEAKAEIFTGLEPGGAAVINADAPCAGILLAAATAHGARIVRFGETAGCDSRLEDCALRPDGSSVSASILATPMTYKLGAPGRHLVLNSLAVLSAAALVGADLARAAFSLAELGAPKGRGERHSLSLANGTASLIDESYNANPASMRAAIALLGQAHVGLHGRRIAVLGDMLELGPDGASLHADLAGPLAAARVDRLYCVGPLMRALWQAVPDDIRAAAADRAGEIEADLLADIRAGDTVMIKGSNGTKTFQLVEALKKRYAQPVEPGEKAV
ncbi:MAG: UDP-N-acetylmuramoylalanyl-D-glutamyl-2,6-diaminopimelate--D-alanyl-D-alanine ligase [Hyphomicrobiaceae bacterium]|nr:UDP-N-acetylmuramoylalanyl-D-glutamyl-2,6-diaminopimelate--D-alanyl-D-alanine ligase [Hyphomicrobiaceae bacterium]